MSIRTIGCAGSFQIRRFTSSLGAEPLYDSFNRVHNYLRISLTERCNLRCTYCMPSNGVSLTERSKLLTLDELNRLASIFVRHCGISKVRLTGGEPTVDSKLFPLLESLTKLREHGLNKIAITTNGLTLKRNLVRYQTLGLDCLNISLDTLVRERFEKMTRRKGFDLVMEGLRQTLDSGFENVKLNCVVIRSFNDDELESFCQLAVDHPIAVRFIEFMPFLGNEWNREAMITMREMLATIKTAYKNLERIGSLEDSHDTSKIYRAPGMLGSIGFISSMSDNFCSTCNRLRLTADGQLKTCLFDQRETSLRDLIRHGASDGELVSAVRRALGAKRKEHADMMVLEKDVGRPMVKIDECHQDKLILTHLNEKGEANMVNINEKSPTRRTAVARGRIVVGQQVLQLIRKKELHKGDLISIAKIAGIMSAKQTSNLIPLCHQIPLTHIKVDIRDDKVDSLIVEASVETHYKTGVEMECLVAVSVTLLTIYDMCKSVNKSMVMSDVKLLTKTKCTHNDS